MNTPHFNFRMDPPLKAALVEASKHTGQSMTDIIRLALYERFLSNVVIDQVRDD